MTGSGKTGLGVVLVEEALAAGVPVLLIDPKGDLTNLCLTFPQPRPGRLRAVGQRRRRPERRQVGRPSSPPPRPRRGPKGLAGWGMRGSTIAALRATVEFTIYTPGSSGGVGLNIVGSLQAPADVSDAETVGDEIDGFVSGLLGLVGIDADPLSSREHILLSNLIHDAWTEGLSLDLPTLVGQVIRRRRSASSACSSSTSSSRRRTAPRSPCGSTGCSPRRRSPRG